MPDLSEFHEYVKRGDLGQVRAALEGDPSLLDAINPAGQSAFLLAKYYHQHEAAEFLLGLNPALDLFNAAVAGRTATVIAEVDRDPAAMRRHSSDGWTPLHLAAFFGHSELASALLDRGADVNARSSNGLKNAPLHAAAAGGHSELVALLLSRGAEVNAVQEGGWTALHSAAQAGNRSMAESLIAGGADCNLRAANNQLPLDLALSQGNSEVAALLERCSPGFPAQ